MRPPFNRRTFAARAGVLTILFVCSLNLGCVGLASNLLHAIYGHEQKPEYEGLKKQRIAVLCSNERGTLKDEVTNGLATTLRMAIANKLKKATVISQTDITPYLMDSPSREEVISKVGRGANADVVIHVDVSNMKLLDGKTMYRGVSDVEVELHDIKENKILFTKSIPAYTYPQTAAISTAEMDMARFQKMYVMIMGERISRFFVPHQMGSEIAEDARILEF